MRLSARLCLLLRRYVTEQRSEPALSLLREESACDELLVNFFCYAMEFDPLEKQVLLDAASLRERADRLYEIADFALGAIGPRAPGNERCH